MVDENAFSAMNHITISSLEHLVVKTYQKKNCLKYEDINGGRGELISFFVYIHNFFALYSSFHLVSFFYACFVSFLGIY